LTKIKPPNKFLGFRHRILTDGGASSKRSSITREDLKAIFENTSGKENKIIIKLLYGTGLLIEQILNLRLTDVDFKLHTLKLPSTNKTSKRNIPLPTSLVVEMKEHVASITNSKFLFPPSHNTSKSLTRSRKAVSRVFKIALKESGINEEYNLYNLRYSYVKHLSEYGFDISDVLLHMGISKSNFGEYALIDNTKRKIDISPLDLIGSATPKAHIQTDGIENLLKNVLDPDEKSYLLEALSCIHNGTLRAGVIMAWTAAIHKLRTLLLKYPKNELNDAIQRHRKSARSIKSIDDFSYIQDITLIETSCTIGLFDKSQIDHLRTCLQLRNSCSHPSKYKPTSVKVTSFLDDIINIIWISTKT